MSLTGFQWSVLQLNFVQNQRAATDLFTVTLLTQNFFKKNLFCLLKVFTIKSLKSVARHSVGRALCD